MRIRIRLWQRLFIAFAGLSILALATFAVLQQQSLRRGFLDYLNRLSLERVSDGAVRLGQRYDAEGNWDFIRGRPDELMRILGLPAGPPGGPGRGGRGGSGSLLAGPGSQDRGPPPNGGSPGEGPPPGQGPPPGGGWPPPPPRDGQGGMRPPPGPGRDQQPPGANPNGPPPGERSLDSSASPGDRPAFPAQPSPSSEPPRLVDLPPATAVSVPPHESSGDAAADNSPEPPPPMSPEGPPPPRPAGPLDLRERLLLVDAQGQAVAGNPDVPADSPSVPVLSHGSMVGRLLLAPMPKLRGDLDLSFAQTQLQHALLTACGVLLGALLVSWLLARWLLAPIHALGKGSRSLVAGNFATRIASTRSDELGALADDFNQLASTLQKNQDARRRWGADIAHELRTPIGILRGEIQALQDGIRKPGPETLGSLQSECDRLASLVEDLYQLALSDAGALAYRMEPLDMGDLLRDLVQSHAGAMKDAGLEFALDASPVVNLPVQADAQRLMQLFGNLLRNAMRYTNTPGKVRITARRVGSDCLVEVEDTPPGVPPASLTHLFDRLYRVEASRSREFGGAGLGLAICRNIAQAHGGQIVASSSSMGGLCISLRLPLAGELR